MNTLDRINLLLKATGGCRIVPATERHHNLHRELDGIDRQLGINTGSSACRRPSCICRGTGRTMTANVGERVRRLEHAVVQRDVARTFNGTPDYFHLGYEADRGALAA